MKTLKFVSLTIFVSCLFGFSDAQAEPWLSNRYAQNCAACHSPGRLNRVAAGRRCTLSCNGCHVSPQGGGMRNQYGVWLTERWLRSTRSEFFPDKSTPAPLDRQPYFSAMKKMASEAHEYYGGRRPKLKDRPVGPALTARKDVDIVYLKGVNPPEIAYDKDSFDEWKAVANNEADAVALLPKDDPFVREKELSVYAGGDFRYFMFQSSDTPVLKGKKERFSLMGVDVGVRMRPTKFQKLSAVVEAQFGNGVDNNDLEDGFTQEARAKSAYLLYDNAGYNSFAMAGIYRPMFGLSDTDHNSLSSEISGLTQKASFKAFGVGTAPNVPYFTANIIQPYNRTSNEFATSDGYTATVGARFVSYGASIAGSYWSTKFKGLGVDYGRKMYALTAGGMIKNFIANIEMLRVQVDNTLGAKNVGSVFTVHTKYRVFRESYLMANYAMANVSRDVTGGSASEITLGAKSFLISNLELEGVWIKRREDTSSPKNSTYDLVQLQMHAFF